MICESRRYVRRRTVLGLLFLLLMFVLVLPPVLAFGRSGDPLPSWNDGAAKTQIMEFVRAVVTENSPDYVPPDERIAVFDNDGTLWIEQPIYTQLAFAIDRVKALAPEHPEWRDKQPFKAVLQDDHDALTESGLKGILELVMASHSGITTEEFA